MATQSRFKINLFYSYSHKDQKHRDRMQRSLALLRDQDRVLSEWYDHKILPGTSLSKEIESQLISADIIAFLFSPHFIASRACMDEWRLAKSLLTKKTFKICIPIILKPCSWRDIDGLADLKALPVDAQPITTYLYEDEAWQEVYLGIKKVIDQLKQTFTIKDDFLREVEQTDFLSQTRVKLQDIFVFPTLTSYVSKSAEDIEQNVETVDDILVKPLTLIHGEQLSGKTALCRHIVLNLIDSFRPVLYIDLKQTGYAANRKTLQSVYVNQFNGDYNLWMEQSDRTLIIDNLSSVRASLNFLSFAIEHFDRVIVTLSSDIFYAYYRDEDRIAGFREIKILPLTHSKQESLIRNRSKLVDRRGNVSDGQIDDLERRVNSIVINNRILPRYPFYVLTILQTQEIFMPSNLSVTSYGHCYYVMIIAHLFRSGISKSDDEINSCFNFAEHLAFEIHQRGSAQCRLNGQLNGSFIEEYRNAFIIKDSTLHRLFDPDYGLVMVSDEFRNSYMYYYFLGKYLANNSAKHTSVIEGLLNESYLPANCLTLVSIIHHTNDDSILEDILVRTMCALESVPPSTLDRDESKTFETIIHDLPLRVLSNRSVASERKRERDRRDRWEIENIAGWGEDDVQDRELDRVESFNDIYRILKNNQILGQVLRNKYGSLRQDRLCEVIETIADGGLRLVRLLLDRRQINEAALFVHRRYPKVSVDRARWLISMFTFSWTMINVRWVVEALNKPEVYPLVQKVVADKDCPAYDLIEYFLHLDTIDSFRKSDRTKLKVLLDKHQYSFFERVVSLRTQSYLNTHTVHEPIEQAVCSILKVKYQRRIKQLS